MSHSGLNAPTSSSTTSRQQLPLRDYLNARVAPFLKKAITESLDVEAEFPLQWLGECLIHQSILYEGNPDRTNIREKFVYKFEDPKPQEETTTEPTVLSTEPPPQDMSVDNRSDVMETPVTAIDPASSTQTQEPVVPHASGLGETAVVNGVKEKEEGITDATDDAEMGGV